MRAAVVNAVVNAVMAPQGKKVLELGCGHGLPGIVAMMAGADVHFQVRMRMRMELS